MNDIYVRAKLCLIKSISRLINNTHIKYILLTEKISYAIPSTCEFWRNAKKIRPNANISQRNTSDERRNTSVGGRNTTHTWPNAKENRPNAKKIWRNTACYLLMSKILFCVCLAHAGQRESSPAATGVANQDTLTNGVIDITAQGIQIGQEVPDIQIQHMHNYSTTTAHLKDFRGKWLILDFWATWCSPCVGMIPRMDSLQRTFGSHVQFLSVTYQSSKEVLPFLSKFEKQKEQHFSLPVVTADNKLRKLFPHKTLPHYVWINPAGVVAAITDAMAINTRNIKSAFAGQLQVATKADKVQPYDLNKPLLINGNGGEGQDMQYHSLLTRAIPYLPAGYDIFKDENKQISRIVLRNVSLTKCYQVAFRNKAYFSKNRILYHVKDKQPFTNEQHKADSVWLKESAVCYELQVPSDGELDAIELMQQDLVRLFPQYKARVLEMKRDCLVLKRKGTVQHLETHDEKLSAKFSKVGCQLTNYPIAGFVMQLNVIFMQHSLYPVLNESKLDRINLKLEADMSNWQDLNRALSPYGLCLQRTKRKIKMLVIEDN